MDDLPAFIKPKVPPPAPQTLLWCNTHGIPALQCLRQENQKFKVSFGHIARSKSAWD